MGRSVRGTFCSWDVLFMGRFVATDVLFVPYDFLAIGRYVLQGGFYPLGRYVL